MQSIICTPGVQLLIELVEHGGFSYTHRSAFFHALTLPVAQGVCYVSVLSYGKALQARGPLHAEHAEPAIFRASSENENEKRR